MPPSKAQKAERKFQRSGPWGKVKIYLAALGPGLVTGASDDDPSGIGTYSQTGAQFGYAHMKSKVNGRVSNTLGWITTTAMSIAAVALLLTLGAGQ